MQLSEQEKRELRDIFDLVDRDKGGTISSEELVQLMRTLGLSASAESVAAMVREIDTDQNGVIDYSEFQAVMTRGRISVTSSYELTKAFEIFRRDTPSGMVKIRDLKDALMNYGEKSTRLTATQTNELLTQVGLPTNDDAVMDFSHFVTNMTT